MSYEIDIIDLLFHTSTMQVKLQNGTSPEYQHIPRFAWTLYNLQRLVFSRNISIFKYKIW